MGEKMIKLFTAFKNAIRNQNLYSYYFDKWAEAYGNYCQAESELRKAKSEIEKLKNDLIHKNGKIINLEKQLEPYLRQRFKKGRIPWNKGKKFK